MQRILYHMALLKFHAHGRQHIGKLEHKILVLLKSWWSTHVTASKRICVWASLSCVSAGIVLQRMDYR